MSGAYRGTQDVARKNALQVLDKIRKGDLEAAKIAVEDVEKTGDAKDARILYEALSRAEHVPEGWSSVMFRTQQVMNRR